MADPDRFDLDDAYGVETPDDNRRLYRNWAPTYDSRFRIEHGYVYHRSIAQIFQTHSRGPETVEPVLDVGCGTGAVAEGLDATSPVTIDGLDISPEMLAVASSKRRGDGTPLYRNLIEADLTRPLTIESATYGGVVSAGTFTHGHVGPDAIEGLVACLRPGGLLCLGINAEHFSQRGFDRVVEDLSDRRLLSAATTTSVPIYDASPDAHEHAGDRALVLTARAGT